MAKGVGEWCDLYCTAMISQGGSHQQLRKALELAAEMRGRGIACNVHTYSALMNVCIKVSTTCWWAGTLGSGEVCTPTPTPA